MSHVVAICGMMGSGKSTLLDLLSSQLGDCIVLEEDAYNPAPLKSIGEVKAWWDRGGQVDEFDLSALVSALEAATAASDRVVFLETQFGRLHAALRPHIDLQVWIDVDADIAFARKVAQLTRQMLSNPESASAADSLAWLAEFCDSYVQTTRQLFARQRTQVGQQSDERLNGNGTPQKVCERLQALLAPLLPSPNSSTMAQEIVQ
ncbi:AAA family ATPase [Fuerstiella marisgermanici]|uniref:Uridine/cytidine kinase n=1 Tax=Fuerstiella marisgermanici TaxID=1891926 RepID=A0A1P8WC56_9PLAN|nr:AAA family ATPase [Fuerstiella marisgermanici]APZ91650.1 uridine/cytidine kinase [Fuerstiella marisgermanici]